MRRVTLAQLEKETKGEPFLTYFGVEGDHHRFQTEDGRVFQVARGEWTMPAPMSFPTSAGMGLFVTVKDGKVRIPDPAAMSEWVRRRGLDRPDPLDMPAFEGHRRDPLPVARYDTSSEPAELVLTSDGDWSREDLGRLDDVLAAWLRDERPGRERDADLPDDQRPLLRFDKDRSAADLKTIVVRARRFRSEWCESLAARLAREFPFLWTLEVGEKPASDYPRP